MMEMQRITNFNNKSNFVNGEIKCSEMILKRQLCIQHHLLSQTIPSKILINIVSSVYSRECVQSSTSFSTIKNVRIIKKLWYYYQTVSF